MRFPKPKQLAGLDKDDLAAIMLSAFDEGGDAAELCEDFEVDPAVVREIKKDYKKCPLLRGDTWGIWEISAIIHCKSERALVVQENEGGIFSQGECDMAKPPTVLRIVKNFLDDCQWAQWSDVESSLHNYQPELIPDRLIHDMIARCLVEADKEYPEKTPEAWMAKRYTKDSPKRALGKVVKKKP